MVKNFFVGSYSSRSLDEAKIPLRYCPRDKNQTNSISGDKPNKPNANYVVKMNLKNDSADFKIPPPLPKQIAKQALEGFMPFKNDDLKSLQYMEYLKYYADELPDFPRHLETQWIQEFRMAAFMFRPLPTEMNSRFTRSIEIESTRKNENFEPQYSKRSLGQHESLNQSNGMRAVSSWSPSNLLCNRFGVLVADSPVSINTSIGKTKENEKISKADAYISSNRDLFDRPDLDVFEQIFQNTL